MSKLYDKHENLKRKLKSFAPDAAMPHEAIALIKRSGLFRSWQYNGAAEFGKIIDWCEEHFGDEFIWNWETIYFKHERDYAVFTLRWV